jgi:hypothetical protein
VCKAKYPDQCFSVRQSPVRHNWTFNMLRNGAICAVVRSATTVHALMPLCKGAAVACTATMVHCTGGACGFVSNQQLAADTLTASDSENACMHAVSSPVLHYCCLSAGAAAVGNSKSSTRSSSLRGRTNSSQPFSLLLY